jgi:hypothetical protein
MVAQKKLLVKLLRFDFQIHYKKKREILAIDALSQKLKIQACVIFSYS